jgi:hypothetical protein
MPSNPPIVDLANRHSEDVDLDVFEHPFAYARAAA